MKKKITFLLLTSTLSLLFIGCSKEDLQVREQSTELRTINGFIQNNFDLSLFYAGLEQADLLDELSESHGITVFAPSNEAFNAVGIYSGSDFKSLNQDSLRFMLRYHVLKEPLVVEDIPIRSVDSKYANLAGKEMFVAASAVPYLGLKGKRLIANGSVAKYQDIQLENGMLTIISAVLKYKEGTVQDWLSSHPDYTCFVTGLKKFGLWEQLANQDNLYTVVAVNNESFAQMGITLQSLENLDASRYGKRLFGGYVFNTRAFLSDLTVFGNTLSLKIPGDRLYSSSMAYNVDRKYYQFHLGSSSNATDRFQNSILFSPDYAVNYLTDNGVIHQLLNLIITPEQASTIYER